MATFKDKDGNDVEIPDENVNAYMAPKITEAVTAKEAEFAPKITALEQELTGTKTALKERAGEFAQFRKLSDEAVEKLSVAEKTIYENGLALEEERQKRVALETTTRENAVASVIKAKAGSNDKLEAKMKELWPLIGIEANTPEQLEQKAQMILGAISTTQPDLVASIGSFSGQHMPPENKPKDGQTFADTEAGKAAAAGLGLMTEPPKQQ